jgi:protein-disulfide isomerase
MLVLTVCFHVSHVEGTGAGSKPEDAKETVLAEMEGETLTIGALPEKHQSALIPVRNDEYRILRDGVNQWLEERILEKEAAARGVAVNDLLVGEIWSKVRIAPEAVQEYYAHDPKAQQQPFDNASAWIYKKLRWDESNRIKREFLEGLHEKYKVKIHLEKPESYVENLGVPTSIPAKRVEFDDLAGKPALGPENAPVTLVEFSDFHCPFCKRVTPVIAKLLENYPGKIRRVWRHYPLAMHQGADLTHQAAQCAAEQGKFWEYHGKLFGTEGKKFDQESLTALAGELDLDPAKFSDCLTSGRYQDLIRDEVAKGNAAGVRGTPAFFINGLALSGAQPYEKFEEVIKKELSEEKTS